MAFWNPGMVGLGNVGLDYSAPSDMWYQQEMQFRSLVWYLKSHHVLVIHCQGMRRIGLEVHARCIFVLRGMVSL